MLDYIRLIRVGNLLLIATTQYLMRYALIEPILRSDGLQPILTDVQFFFLVGTTLLVVGGGYIINDYFDSRIDAVNKSKKLLVGFSIKRRYALLWSGLFSVVGIGISVYLSRLSGIKLLFFVQLIGVFVLLKYSEVFKRKFLTGNILIALLMGLAVLMPALYETVALSVLYRQSPNLAKALFYTILVYTLFGVLVVFVREVLKDMQDIDGDIDVRAKTVPIVWGINRTKWLLIGILVFIFGSIGYFIYIKLIKKEYIIFFYTAFGVLVPCLLTMFQVAVASTKTQFQASRQSLKILTLGGIFSLMVFYWIYKFQ